jgi:hypothetical protein
MGRGLRLQKVLIWSTFVENVEHIANSLQDLGAVYIHGGVDAGDENDDETREGKSIHPARAVFVV